jgi:hypothetical protein
MHVLRAPGCVGISDALLKMLLHIFAVPISIDKEFRYLYGVGVISMLKN